jgi:SpoIID/LytB domain protein
VFCSPRTVPPADLAKYLGAVDEQGEYYRWTVEYSREELESILLRKHFDRIVQPIDPPLDRLEDIAVVRRGQSARAIALNVAYLDRQGRSHTARIADQYWIRNALHDKFLYSSAFKIDCERDGDQTLTTIRLTGAGWGHGAGLCQIGALGMAMQDYDYRTILHHYFERMTVERAYA